VLLTLSSDTPLTLPHPIIAVRHLLGLSIPIIKPLQLEPTCNIEDFIATAFQPKTFSMGFQIRGSPVTPWLYDGAFNRNRGRNISKHWKMIPANTDDLITHGPPYGILDKNRVRSSAGCQSLKRVVKRIQPMLHVFGHIH
jgi:hypothetical protein